AAAPATYAAWAAQYGLAADSGAENADSDALTNSQEFSANTDPISSDTDGDGISDSDETSGVYANLKIGSPVTTNPLTGDTDVDGLPDKWELDNYLNPTDDGMVVSYTNYIPSAYGLTITGNPNGAGSNPDADALTNLQEFAGTKNPLVAEGDIASTYEKMVVAGSFVQTKPDGNWDEVGNAVNTMQLVSNFTWKLIVYVPAARPSFAQFKFTTGSWATNFGDNAPANGIGDAGGANINALPAFTAAGHYMITFNDFSKAYSIAAVAATDVDNDSLPDEWEAFYGGYLNPKLTNLNPATAYVTGGLTAAQAYAAGSNPVADTVAPAIALATGVDKVTWVAKDAVVTLANADVTASDAITTSPAVSFLPATVSTATDGLTTVTYTATDAAGNANTVTRAIVVGSGAPGYRNLRFPAAMSINTLSSDYAYGEIYVDGATAGAGAASGIRVAVGVNTSNTDPSTWNESAW
ncbi:MAG: binary toxin-like calcium binding domain-containing protein, partial [Verrucomicrobiota bacterium]